MPVQSEAALENGLIATLQQMNYEYVQIEEEKNLRTNFKSQLEKHNRKRLEETGRTFVTSFRLNWMAENACGWNS